MYTISSRTTLGKVYLTVGSTVLFPDDYTGFFDATILNPPFDSPTYTLRT